MNQIMIDEKFMLRAIKLAKFGVFTADPNPIVGCVIVLNENIVGEGFHFKAGEKHAEIIALSMAGKKSHGATMYVTLEPCVHFGKTGPCVDALIYSGIKRVVVAMKDPNPKINGLGLEKLKRSGVYVTYGILKKHSENLNLGFLKRMKKGIPYIQLKLASSLDGRTSLSSGKSKWITSFLSRQDVQKFRAKSSAVLTTSSTVLYDNPFLNVRWSDFSDKLKSIYPEENIRQPIRIVLDKNNKITSNCNVTNPNGECWIIKTKHSNNVWNKNVKEICISNFYNKNELIYIMQLFAKKNVNSIFVESGPTFAGILLKLNLIDELIIYISPKLFGGTGNELIKIDEVKLIKYAPRFKLFDFKLIGADIRLKLYPLKNNYR